MVFVEYTISQETTTVSKEVYTFANYYVPKYILTLHIPPSSIGCLY